MFHYKLIAQETKAIIEINKLKVIYRDMILSTLFIFAAHIFSSTLLLECRWTKYDREMLNMFKDIIALTMKVWAAYLAMQSHVLWPQIVVQSSCTGIESRKTIMIFRQYAWYQLFFTHLSHMRRLIVLCKYIMKNNLYWYHTFMVVVHLMLSRLCNFHDP